MTGESLSNFKKKIGMTKAQAKERSKFMERHESQRSVASKTFKGLLEANNLSIEQLRIELFAIGFQKSLQTVYGWVSDPLLMSRYESNAVAMILNIEPGVFDSIIQGGKTSIESISAITVKIQ